MEGAGVRRSLTLPRGRVWEQEAPGLVVPGSQVPGMVLLSKEERPGGKGGWTHHCPMPGSWGHGETSMPRGAGRPLRSHLL